MFDLSDQKLKEYDLKNNIDHIDMCAERVHDYNEEGRLNERSFLIPNIRFILDKLSTSPSSSFLTYQCIMYCKTKLFGILIASNQFC